MLQGDNREGDVMKSNQIAFVLALIVWMGLSGAAFAAEVCSTPVETAQGLIAGQQDKDYSACSWKGVPYAAPPVDDLRWKAPQPPLAHAGILEAFAPGAACMQPELITAGGDLTNMSEDCLTLNIWRPNKSGQFPVMFWIHGGGFRTGSGGFDIYDGARLAAEQDVMVVTINYRVGWQGFLALPELVEEDPNNSAGNYAHLDQIQALRWVRQNIEAFGGDPNNVTVFGQSAGGVSGSVMMTSPLAKGLLHKLIIQSGPCDQAESLEKGYEKGRAWVKEVGCDGPDVLECLRSKPAEEVTSEGGNLILTGGVFFMPHYDGYVLDKDPVSYMKAGEYPPMPLLIGTTRDEVMLYTLTIPGTLLMPRFTVDSIMRKLTGPAYDDMMSLYSYRDYKHPIDFFHQVATDMALTSRAYMIAETVSKDAPVYMYRFDWDETRVPAKMGAFHSLDVPFVFGALDLDFTLAKLVANKKTIDKALPLVGDIMTYWANFAKNGDPNGDGLEYWPQYNSSGKLRLHLDTPIDYAPIEDIEIERFEMMNRYDIEGMYARERE
jgi:para-nitrobenzyl esterase